MRLDLYLVEKKLASSRTQAQDFISQGAVYLLLPENKKKLLDKSNYIVKIHDEIIVTANDLQKYVSRAGLKLENAFQKLQIGVENKTVLDVGQSTGGFTDFLLQKGAAKVVGIDVGHGQLHEKLKNDRRVISFEGLNVKDLSVNTAFLREAPVNHFDLITADVSFISLTKIIPTLAQFLKEGAEYLFLVKPQFECGPQYLDRHGIVKDEKAFALVEQNIKACAEQYFKNVTAYIVCDVPGKDGNQEFFIYGQKA